MSFKIKLFYETYIDPEITKFIANYNIIRLKGIIRFVKERNYSDPFKAIIDTGAHISLIPQYMWKELNIENLGKYEVRGISNKPECNIPSIIGKLGIIIQDRYGNSTKKLKIHSCLALTNEVPLILGFKDLLSKFKVCFDYDQNEAYIETKK